MSFPIDFVSYRHLPAEWEGEVVFCDIDRTYLATRFSSLKSMARIPFEFAIDKQDIPGMAGLLHEVRRGPQRESRHTPLFFISASPPQLRSVIERKMLLDGLEFDATIFKDWLGVVWSRRLRRFREQIGFKLTALLRLQAQLPLGRQDVLIGDDLESDSLAFCLYADIIAGRLVGAEIVPVLMANGVAADDAADISRLAAGLDPGPQVKRIYIRLDRHEADKFVDFAPHLIAANGAFQIAVCMYAEKGVSLAGVVRVARDLVGRGVSRETLHAKLADAVRRGLIARSVAAEVREGLAQRGLAAARSLPHGLDRAWARALERPSAVTWTPAHLLRRP